MYDTIIIGAGPAGVTAAIYAARKKLKTLLISPDIGGQILGTWEIENYPALISATGVSLSQKFTEHLKQFAIKIEKEKVAAITKDQPSGFEVKTQKKNFKTKTLILAMGKKPRELSVPGESKFKNKGVTYCATCDGPLFANKIVAIAGGGNSGLETAIQMDKIAKKIYLIENGAICKGDPLLLDRVKSSKKTQVLTQTKITEIFGQNLVKGIKIENIKTGKVEKIVLDGIFVEIGSMPNSQLVKNLVILDKNNKIKIDKFCHTNVKGIFACGDITNVAYEQIIIAAGEGAKAAISAFNYLAKQKTK